MNATHLWIAPNLMLGNTQPVPGKVVKVHNNGSWRSATVVTLLVMGQEEMDFPANLLSETRQEKTVVEDEFGTVTVWK